MGKPTTTAADLAVRKVEGSFGATGQSAWMQVSGAFNVSLWGTFVGTAQLERSFDGGATALPVTNLGASVAFTAPCTEIVDEPEAGVLYRWNCTAWTSGTINYRMGQ